MDDRHDEHQEHPQRHVFDVDRIDYEHADLPGVELELVRVFDEDRRSGRLTMGEGVAGRWVDSLGCTQFAHLVTIYTLTEFGSAVVSEAVAHRSQLEWWSVAQLIAASERGAPLGVLVGMEAEFFDKITSEGERLLTEALLERQHARAARSLFHG